MTYPAELLTERLRLRPPAVSDAENMFERYGQDALVCRYMNWVPNQSIEDTLEYLRRTTQDAARGTVLGYLIFTRDSGQLLGSVGGAIQGSRMQFGYCLARDSWGKGYATEAASQFVATVFECSDLWRVQAFCDVENRASAHVLEKCGLKYEGTLRRYMVLPNLGDAPRDMMCFAKVRDEAT